MTKKEIKSSSGGTDTFLKKIITDRAVRRAITQQSHSWFFGIYFADHIKYESAAFHKELFALTEDPSVTTLVVVAFRGSGKTTIMTQSLPLWSILGVREKKHVLILAQTMPQAKQHLKNIKDELQNNDLLRKDLGPFREEDDEWRSHSIVIPRYGARITAASIEQSVRGMKHGAHRPDLIILDDIEDLNSVRTQEARDKVYNWVMGDVMPLGDKDTQFVFVGNLLHDDSLLMRLKKNIEEKKMNGIYREYPLLNEDGSPIWPGKYQSEEDIEAERKKTASEAAFEREFNLKIIPGDDFIVKPEWIHYYEDFPMYQENRFTVTGVDVAISKSSTADYTAMVSLKAFGYHDNMMIYILPNPINERLDFPEQIERIIWLSRTLGNGYATKVCPEAAGYQVALPQILRDRGIPVREVKPSGLSKEDRLQGISYLIKNGRILFPKEGAELLIRQILRFGAEKHDDLMDAFVYAIMGVLEENKRCAIAGVGRLDRI